MSIPEHRTDGTVEWRNTNGVHREDDLPALIKTNGTTIWARNNKLSRPDSPHPSMINGDGTLEWREQNKLHHDEDLPSRISSTGNIYWHKHGELHRLHKPAIIPDGTYFLFGSRTGTEENHKKVIEALGGLEMIETLPHSYLKELTRTVMETAEETPKQSTFAQPTKKW